MYQFLGTGGSRGWLPATTISWGRTPGRWTLRTGKTLQSQSSCTPISCSWAILLLLIVASLQFLSNIASNRSLREKELLIRKLEQYRGSQDDDGAGHDLDGDAEDATCKLFWQKSWVYLCCVDHQQMTKADALMWLRIIHMLWDSVTSVTSDWR